MTRPKKKLWPRNKWHLALTLINNPAIVADRWKVMMYEQREKKQSAGKVRVPQIFALNMFIPQYKYGMPY